MAVRETEKKKTEKKRIIPNAGRKNKTLLGLKKKDVKAAYRLVTYTIVKEKS